jgi:O-antigen/teichoic acid export membrane protein
MREADALPRAGLGRRMLAGWNRADMLGATRRAALLAVLGRCINAGLVFLTQMLFARALGAEGFGAFTAAQAWLLLLAAVATLGISAVPQRFLPEYAQAGDGAAARGLVRFVLLVPLLAGAALALLTLGVLHLLAGWLSPAVATTLSVTILALPAVALASTAEGVALARGWNDLAQVLSLVLRPLLVPVLFGVAWWAGFSPASPVAAAAYAAAVWAAALLLVLGLLLRLCRPAPPAWPLDKAARRAARVLPPRYEARRWLATALPVAATEGAFMLMTSTDVIILSALMGESAVGIYGAAAKLVALVAFIHGGLSLASGHHFSALARDSDPQALGRYAVRTARWTFWPSLATAVLVLLLASPVLRLLGEAYVAGVGVTALLLAGLLARAAVGPAEQLLIMNDRQGLCARIHCAGFLANAVLTVPLVHAFGLPGAAAATALSYTLAALLLARAVARELGIALLPLPALLCPAAAGHARSASCTAAKA